MKKLGIKKSLSFITLKGVVCFGNFGHNEMERREREAEETGLENLQAPKRYPKCPGEIQDLGDRIVFGSYDFEKEAFVGKTYLKGENPEDCIPGKYEYRSYA